MAFWTRMFYLDWKALCDLQYENIAEKPDEAMAFYIRQPIKNAQHAKIKATKTTFLVQKNLRELILFSFEPFCRDKMNGITKGLPFWSPRWRSLTFIRYKMCSLFWFNWAEGKLFQDGIIIKNKSYHSEYRSQMITKFYKKSIKNKSCHSEYRPQTITKFYKNITWIKASCA